MASYPTIAATDAQLFVAVNNLSTALNGAVNAVVTTLTVVSTTGFPTAGYVTIDSEAISYTGTNATQFTGCTRGADGTTAATHVDASQVKHTVVAAHHNVLKDELKAVEGDLVAAMAALTPVAAASTAASLLIRLEHIVSQIKNGFGLTNWYDVVTAMLPKSGGTMSGNIAMGSNKVTGLAAASGNGEALRYEQVNGIYLPLAGGTMAADIAMGSNKLTGLSAGSAAGNSVRFEQMKVIQYVSMTTAVQFSSTSATFVDTNTTLSITPTSASNKVLIFASGKFQYDQSAVGTQGFITLKRTATNLGDSTEGFGFLEGQTTSGTSDTGGTPITITYVDSPATTSSTTYTVQIRRGGGTVYFPKGTVPCTLVLVEVAS